MRKRRERPKNSFAASRDLTPQNLPIDTLRPLGRRTRKHPAAQIKKIVRSLHEYNLVAPVIVDDEHRIVAGEAVVSAAKQMGATEIPAVVLHGMSEARSRSLRTALNRLGEDSSWDPKEMALEFADILSLEPDVDFAITGHEMGEVDAAFRSVDAADDEIDDVAAPSDVPPVCQPGDLFACRDHRVLCADATAASSYEQLMDGELAQAVVADPPYNIPIAGNVSGLGATQHADFVMAYGEMTEPEFMSFLQRSLALMAAHSVAGSLHYLFMDWRHAFELLSASREVYAGFVNLCVWVKDNAGMGSFYRSQYELVFVCKNGTEPHINNIALGRYGRHRSNVWRYPGYNGFTSGRTEALASHPTAKPPALIQDVILDASNRGGLILDPFLGSGTSLIAAERVGRRCFGLELDPRYVDVALRRFRRLTGIEPVHAATGDLFRDIEERSR